MTKNGYNQSGLFDYIDFNLVTLGINSNKPATPLRDMRIQQVPSKDTTQNWYAIT